jgi:hypothetical protein
LPEWRTTLVVAATTTPPNKMPQMNSSELARYGLRAFARTLGVPRSVFI